MKCGRLPNYIKSLINRTPLSKDKKLLTSSSQQGNWYAHLERTTPPRNVRERGWPGSLNAIQRHRLEVAREHSS
jgi:hypothetical protein